MIHDEIKTVLAITKINRSDEAIGRLVGTSHGWPKLLHRRLPKSILLIEQLLNANGYRLAVVKMEPQTVAE